MRRFDFVLLAVLGAAVLPGPPAFGQPRAVDVRASWGYANGLDDSPPHALLGGVSATAAVSPHVRLGAELWKANLFGPYGAYRTRARLVNALMEYELAPGRRVNPYWLVGIGVMQHRTLYPVGHVYVPEEGWVPTDAWRWDRQLGMMLTGGVGVRMFLTDRIFVAPEARAGLTPLLQTTVAVGVAF